MFYICTRSLRNGALGFVAKYDDEQKARHVAEMGNHGRLCNGPAFLVYVVISAF
jgi:hypothetical protein